MLRTYGAKYNATDTVVLPPGVPVDRVKALQNAFDGAMKDPAMFAEAKKYGIDIDPFSGGSIAALMREIDAVSQGVIDRLWKIIEP